MTRKTENSEIRKQNQVQSSITQRYTLDQRAKTSPGMKMCHHGLNSLLTCRATIELVMQLQILL